MMNKMIKKLLLCIVSFLISFALFDVAYVNAAYDDYGDPDDLYDDHYEDYYKEAYDEGYNDGYDAGYEDGILDGYSEDFDDVGYKEESMVNSDVAKDEKIEVVEKEDKTTDIPQKTCDSTVEEKHKYSIDEIIQYGVIGMLCLGILVAGIIFLIKRKNTSSRG